MTSTPAPNVYVTSTPAPNVYVTSPPSDLLPRITKDPGSETVAIGGSCQFVTRYENADIAEWHFVSPDGSRDITYLQAMEEFKTLKVIKGYTKDMTLSNIPAELNGWKVYCRFSNKHGFVNTGTASITIQGAPAPQTVTVVPTQRTGYEGVWAEEIAGRCMITFTWRGEGSFNVDISWSGSAFERARWQMTADVYRNDILIYEDGHSWTETYVTDTNYTISNESYGETGSFYIENGKLHWVNNKTGEETVLIPA